MLAIQSISLRAGTKSLLENASLTLHPGQKVGIIGRNGVGKSTLFKAILGQQTVDAGQISMPANWQVGYVQQEDLESALSAMDYVLSGDSLYYQLVNKLKQAEQENDSNTMVNLHDQLDHIQAYQVPLKAEQLLYGLGFERADLAREYRAFSGGWQVRLKLAKALMQRSDLLLLDEPTNHLDIEAVAWLEQWLAAYSGAVLLISHDRHFLDQVVSGIALMEEQRIALYTGNFESYERQRSMQLMQQQSLLDKQKQRMQHLKTFITRFKAKASKAKQAQSRVKALERMEEIAPLQATNPLRFEFFNPDHLPDPMLQVEKLGFGYPDENPLFESIDLVLRAGDRIGLVGVNGSGKSTFLKLIVQELKAQTGKMRYAKGLKVGYFAQHQVEALDLDATPVQTLLREFETLTDQQARDFLGGFGFSHDQALSPIRHFSGGEKARLSLAVIVYQKPNLIILDEPTNHLDMDARDALDEALQAFEGALIVVSHDRHMLAGIVDQYWWVHEGQVSLFHGDLDAYLHQRLVLLKQQKQAKSEAKNDSTQPYPDGHKGLVEDAGLNKKQQRQQNAEQRKRLQHATQKPRKQLEQVNKQLEKHQQRMDELHQQLADESIYQVDKTQELNTLLAEQTQLQNELDELEMQWLELEQQIEEISKGFE
ncbi:ATP-binding cassette domain-containing protein [Thiomicrospira sp. R3]|uniref:ABC-F family ATP-binding cassette domain-containing protein n=1 Tax=Thiomicrospira sp. R3 TaxID=3035472 RepID=UPI00259B1319|nr:ATP-binding cassette domain-containing protein [Thiomicrospira sp. R3]WFE68297.1 ATP-binding cassette domain-containing protein [Thiomicrospira sp. R3]